DRTVVEVDRVVAQTQLPHAAGGCVRERGGGHAALVAPGLAGEVPHALDVAGGAGVVATGQALDVAAVVVALQLEPAADPQALDAGGGHAVGVGHAARIDQSHAGEVGIRARPQAVGVGIGVVVRIRQAEVQDVALSVDRCPGPAQAVAAAVGEVACQLAAEPAGRHAPVGAAEAVGRAEAAAHRVGVGGDGLGDEVVVLGRGQLLHAVGLLVLADLDVVAAAATELVSGIDVEELVGLGVVADHPVVVAGCLYVEYDFRATQFELAVIAVGADAIEVGQVVVEPVSVDLDKAFEADIGTGDRI